MSNERMPHDPAYKQFFSNPEMVESLLRDFVPADFIADLDCSTLERCANVTTISSGVSAGKKGPGAMLCCFWNFRVLPIIGWL